MFGNLMQKAKRNARATTRLREMVSVMRKHDVMSGMTPEKLRLILEDLGPTFMKLGQVLSMRPDLISPEYCDELMKLQSEAKPLSFSVILGVVEKEYGTAWDHIFASIDREPLGSASIAQVHRAVLQSGEAVVIKVQRPGIYEVMHKDILLMRRAVTLLKVFSKSRDVLDFNLVLDEMWSSAKQEMDFMMEADHIQTFANLNRNVPYVTCPHIYQQYSTQHILVMEFIDGVCIDDAQGIRDSGYDIESIGRHLAENYVKQIIEDGYFHADPHPGNIWVRSGRVVWLDLGMVGRLSTQDRLAIRKAIFAIANHDTFELKDAVLALSTPYGPVNHTMLYQDLDAILGKFSTLDFGDLQIGELTQQIMNILRTNHISCLQGLTLFGRGVMTMEGVMRVCCPSVSFIEIFANSLAIDFKKNFSWREEWKNFRREGYIMAKKTVQIPEQVSDLMKMTIGGQTKVNIDLTGSRETLRRLDKMINKLILAVLSSALLLGSSTISTTNMTPKIFEIPLLGILGYMGAFILSIYLIWAVYKEK